jgi:beta-N-acetylhexosaminidase
MNVPGIDELSLDQKIGQLFLARTPKLCAMLATTGVKISEQDVYALLEKGLLCGFYAGRDSTPEEIQSYQEKSSIPLFIATDIETGAVAPDMKSVTPLPMQMAMGAFASEGDAYQWAKMAALEARANGFNYAFGPVVDLALIPGSTCVGLRTFGDDPARVADLGAAVIKGYQDHGLLVSAKHYPGFGGSLHDAHLRMCELDISREKFLKQELSVYKKIIQKVELGGVMTGHIIVPSIDPGDCATTSKPLIDLLRQAGFNGVLITDSLAMKGLKIRVPSKYAHQMALKAGHDLILSDYAISPLQGLQYIREALEEGIISEEIIDRSVERILQAKRRIFSYRPPLFNREEHIRISEEFSRKSITVAGRLPVLDKSKKYLILISEEKERKQVRGELVLDTSFRTLPEDYLKQDLPNAILMRISEYPDAETIEKILEISVQYDEIIVIAYAYPGAYKGNAHFTRPFIHLVNGLTEKISVFVFFGLPFAVGELLPLKCVIYGYLGGFAEKTTFDVLLGREKGTGKLPVKLGAI